MTFIHFTEQLCTLTCRHDVSFINSSRLILLFYILTFYDQCVIIKISPLLCCPSLPIPSPTLSCCSRPFPLSSETLPANECHKALGPNTIRRPSQAHPTHQRPPPPVHTDTHTRAHNAQHFLTTCARLGDRKEFTRKPREVLFIVAD